MRTSPLHSGGCPWRFSGYTHCLLASSQFIVFVRPLAENNATNSMLSKNYFVRARNLLAICSITPALLPRQTHMGSSVNLVANGWTV